jgi:trehalose 6-phosphate synthase
MSRLVVISYRAPSPDGKNDSGGLVVALRDALSGERGLWVGAQQKPVETPAGQLHHHSRDDFEVALFDVTREDLAGHYLGYSNSVLWPVLHGRVDLARFRPAYFRRYCRVAARLAQLLSAELRADDRIWVHDYQLLPLADELRKLGHGNAIGFFLHVPWPPYGSFSAIPEHARIAQWLTQYDLVGLQTQRDVANLLDCLRQTVGCDVLPDGTVSAGNQRFEISSHPISIDFDEFAAMAKEAALEQRRPDMPRIIGVDRLDYSKGLPQRFRGYRHFLETLPEMHRKVFLMQIAPPTRQDVEAYQDIRNELEQLAGSINGAFGDIDWVPIHYIHRSLDRRTLAGLLRHSRIGLVTPLLDGMNLVAKEYVAAQDPADPGVLILSQFAGAAEELQEALIVNPHSVEEIAAAIGRALFISVDERVQRNAALAARIRSHDIAWWTQNYLKALDRAAERRSEICALTVPRLARAGR